ncbi:MAG: cache domain-containing protein [Candidatus Gygaella obscura]|nr:cache domain-containing protein [Candidatus Gygaella obscura]
MKKIKSLKNQILVSFVVIIIVFAVLVSILGFYVIQNDIIARAKNEVENAIDAAETVYKSELDKIKTALLIREDNLEVLKDIIGLDYIYEVDIKDKSNIKSQIARFAFNGRGYGATRVIDKEELDSLFSGLADRLKIDIKSTPKAIPTKRSSLNSVLAIEYAYPVEDDKGNVTSVRYAGKIINKEFSLVDKIRDLVFEDISYDKKPYGTVTIFQDDVRVSTNVLTKNGDRAIGTRVSKEVYDAVITRGRIWQKRAFVVNDWYLTCYKPIKNITGDVIGILYVGILEKPFIDLKMRFFLAFLFIVILSIILAVLLSVFLADRISKPVIEITNATAKISDGELTHRLQNKIFIKEISELANSFNNMAERLHERDVSLKSSKEQVEVLNKRYLDMVGFVSHELKGILSSIVLNTYSLKKGLVGPINEAQRKTLNSISNNLDYLTSTVKNFLSLSRIEKEEMVLNKTKFRLKQDLIFPAIEAFNHQAVEKDINIIDNTESDIELYADISLMQILINNLLSNAVKYGSEHGNIVITAKKEIEKILFEVYNEGRPIDVVDKDKLFRKFSRVIYRGMEKIKGTGIGLYIVSEIVKRHNGKIWLETKSEGNTFKVQFPL